MEVSNVKISLRIRIISYSASAFQNLKRFDRHNEVKYNIIQPSRPQRLWSITRPVLVHGEIMRLSNYHR